MTESELRRVIDTYADGVRSGSIPSCQFIRLAIDRWFDDCQREDLVFDIAPAILFVNFAEQLKHFKGDLAGQPIRLEPWQIFAASNILCWLKKDTGLRRYQYADILVPRKNGKTTFAAILALFLLFLDGEAGAEVYTAAVDKAQAKICFEAAKILIEDSIFEKVMTIRRGEVRYDRNHSHLAPLSKDTKNKDGLNPYCAVCDERHAWPTNEIYDVLNTGMGARSQPLIISISTAGMDTSLPYYTDIQIYKDVMLGHKQLDNHFIMIYTPDDGDRWDDPATWAKVNPNLGVSLLPEYIQQSADEARMKGGTTLASFLVKNLNLWVDAPEVWIPDDQYMANNAPFDEELLKGRECYVGIDLASKGDITATALYFPAFNVFKMIFVIPEAKVRELEDALWKASEEGKYPVLCDQSPCLHRMRARIGRMDGLSSLRAMCWTRIGMWLICLTPSKTTRSGVLPMTLGEHGILSGNSSGMSKSCLNTSRASDICPSQQSTLRVSSGWGN